MNFLNTMNDKANELCIKAIVKKEAVKTKVKDALVNEDGGAQLDNGWTIIIGIIIAGLLLAGMVWLFNDVIFPKTKTSTDAMFAQGDGKAFKKP